MPLCATHGSNACAGSTPARPSAAASLSRRPKPTASAASWPTAPALPDPCALAAGAPLARLNTRRSGGPPHDPDGRPAAATSARERFLEMDLSAVRPALGWWTVLALVLAALVLAAAALFVMRE